MKKKNKRSGKGLSGLVIFGFLALWQGIAMLIGAAYILPTPVQVLQKLWELREPLFLVHLPATMAITGLGLLISLVLGILLAVFMDMNPTAEKALYPLIVASQTIPTMAIAPLFVLWFGYGIWSKVLAAILITFFPVTITIHDGLRSTKREMEEYMETCGAGRWEIFWKLKVPWAIPSFFSAVRMAVPISVIGAAIGEWLGAQSGLGYFSKRMMTQLDGAGVFAPIVLLSAAAMLVVFLVGKLEKHFVTWRKEL
ncbi:ABC transporter permease [Cuneatibacter sp. NSJ-177]|uniref:ABC transporter permease n=1 Tax=Cuneatibacter sp. NSJ-177 TaxID=2931401 RepID=UPI001FD5F707|nr:ABC transporter permease [Cuneatibacter sp. NSJ-177]MCJ7836854.1 ABC transporter permease [Cuneatibacter sp. NSJ-177]